MTKAQNAFLKEYIDFRNDYLNMYGSDPDANVERLFLVYKGSRR